MSAPDTWGSYLDRNGEDIQEVFNAFKERDCPITLYQAAMYRELALLRSTFVEDSEADKQDRDEGEAWKNE